MVRIVKEQVGHSRTDPLQGYERGAGIGDEERRCDRGLRRITRDIERPFDHTAQHDPYRHDEATGRVIASDVEYHRPAPGRSGGVDRALNGRGVVGVTIALSSERFHGKCAGKGADVDGVRTACE